MSAGANEVYYGPYRITERAVNALTAYGVENPEDLDNFTLTELRAIPGFGSLAVKAVRVYRDFLKSVDDQMIDLSEPEPEPEVLPQINICLQVTETGPFRRRHYEWVQNVLKNFSDPGTGNPMETESDFMAFIIRLMYSKDSSKGGTVGVPTGRGDPNTGQPQQDFSVKINA